MCERAAASEPARTRPAVRALLLGIALGALAAFFYSRRNRIAAGPPQTRLDAPADSGAAAVETERAQPAEDLERLTTAELYRRAQAAGIVGRSQMTKAQLIVALRAHGRGSDNS
jgi:hypothetical protein